MTSLSDILNVLNDCFGEAEVGVSQLDEESKLSHHHALFEVLLGRTGTSSDCEDLAKTFKKKLLEARTQPGQSKLNRIRKYLGMWYSTMVLADACSYDHDQTDLDLRIEQRMRSLLVEATAWLEKPLFCQVLIQTKGLNHIDAVGSKSEIVWQCTSGTNKQHLDRFINRVSEFTKQRGSTMQFNVHSRLHHAWSNLNFEPKFELTLENPSLDNIYLTGKTQLELQGGGSSTQDIRAATTPSLMTTGQHSAIRQPGDEDEFVKFVGQPLLPPLTGILHMAAGVDAVFSEKSIVSTITHLYLLLQPGTIYAQYEELFEIILYRLAHFYSTQLQVRETARLRHHATMLSALQAPLGSITSALRTMQIQAQELRAILNEPIEAIFAAQSEIADHFQPGKVFKMPSCQGNIDVQVKHKPDMYNEDGHDCAWVLASALSKIRGAPLAQARDGRSALTQEINCWIEIQGISSNAHYHLANSLARLLALPYTDFKCFEFGPSAVRDTMEVLKERLFTPFKPDHSLKDFPWRLVHAILPIGIEASYIGENKICIPGRINPMRTQGHLLAFISAFFASAASNPSEPVEVEPQIKDELGTVFVMPETSVWVHDPDKLQNEICREVKLALNRAVSLEENWGDLSAPFIKLVRRIPLELLGVEEKIDSGFKYGNFICHRFCETGIALTINTLKVCCHKNKFFIGSYKFNENSLV